MEEDQMSVPGSRAADDINLDEFERRLRAAGAQQASVEDPLPELARLVEFSHTPDLEGEASARPLRRTRQEKRGIAPGRSKPRRFRPAIDERRKNSFPGASEADRAARQDYEFDGPRSHDSLGGRPGEPSDGQGGGNSWFPRWRSRAWR